jgi:hypothetical protein
MGEGVLSIFDVRRFEGEHAKFVYTAKLERYAEYCGCEEVECNADPNITRKV